MTAAVPCPPAEAARRARWFRMYAAREDATPTQARERTATAEAYQDMAVVGGVEAGKNSDDGCDW